MENIGELPDYEVKKYVAAIKKPLAHICNASVEFVSFPHSFKNAKVNPLYSKRNKSDRQKLDQIPFVFFLKSLTKADVWKVNFLRIKKLYITKAQNGFRGKKVNRDSNTLPS
jgi:hypothetical protein